ncbi:MULTISPECIES: helix-turn-helix domain-containing protein [Achromobacter]|jgi:excisionase family DNA binding protein|uniref:helix-turn-helix domain-containing protein n=1 Tax=Achromobacter TaxID=222 RepID=UPI0006C45F23|nr:MULTISPECIES: helix-turn-helix domain-containing protein [Achromobacter]MDF3940026.1 helix-turn-helix domain-containing protein [Achromobacter denitrificans]QQE57422.1 helix-turn-helix domain-containing protein [Achromobacter xylosoxidans]QQV17061.1 helix-turn-helix domain-containing protein [Achromobacter xylosoxidans]CUI48869.1 Helix-turn-helix domain [Achromobacter xylosoxidans]
MAHAAQHQAPAAAPKLLYRVHEAVQVLGLSRPTIYRMCDRGELVKRNIGKTRAVGITADSVNAMLARMSASDDRPAEEVSTQQMGS